MKISAGNIQLNIEDHGSGQTILLIHGFPLNIEMWRPQIGYLSALYRVIAIDLRGHGLTPPTPGPYSMELLADDCAAALAVLGVHEPAVICGLSMGGYISFALYRRHPQLFSGLILAATRAGTDTNQARANRDQAIAVAKKQGSQPLFENMLKVLLAPDTYQDKPELVDNVAEILSQTSEDGVVAALEGMRDRADSTDLLEQIDVPTLILHGEADQIIPLSESELMHNKIPNSILEIIPNAGHLPNMEQPEVFNQLTANFLASL